MMASEELCKFYRGGHCKFGEKCEKSHRIETCDSFPCLKENCSKRHPPLCRFFSRFGRCKFKLECSYLHVINNFKALETEIDNLQKEVNHLKAENETLKLLVVRLSNLENEVNLIKTSPCEKCDEKSTSASELDEHMVSTHGNILTDDVIFQCELCEYTSKSKKGVKIHKKSKHRDKNKKPVVSSPENTQENFVLAEKSHKTIISSNCHDDGFDESEKESSRKEALTCSEDEDLSVNKPYSSRIAPTEEYVAPPNSWVLECCICHDQHFTTTSESFYEMAKDCWKCKQCFFGT